MCLVAIVLVSNLGKILLVVAEILKFQTPYGRVVGGWIVQEENNATL